MSDRANRWFGARLCVGVVVLLACGCQSTPPATELGTPEASAQPVAAVTSADPFGPLPSDLTIDMTILPGWELRNRSEAQLVRSKYIVFPDGSLHADNGRSITVLTRPGLVRRLSRESMSDLWLVLQQTGFAEVTAADFEGNPALLAPTNTTVLTILTVRAQGQIGTFVRRTDGDSTDAAMTRVGRSLALLAWATDDPAAETMVMPRRYDLGPDPYARFRPMVIP